MPQVVPDELIRVLSKRRGFLELLSEEPMSKGELTAELEVSRSTVNRATRELKACGLVKQGDSGLHFTTYGKAAYDQFVRFRECIRSTHAVSREINTVSCGRELDLRLLADVEFVHATPHKPNKPVSFLRSALEETTMIKGILPGVTWPLIQSIVECCTNDGTKFELVVPEEAVLRMQHQYTNQLETLLETDTVTLIETNHKPSFGLLVSNTDEMGPTVHVLIYDEDGHVKSVSESTTDMAVSAAQDLYRSYRCRRSTNPRRPRERSRSADSSKTQFVI